MRMLIVSIFLAGALSGCGPNRKVEKGSVVITAVESIPSSQFQLTPAAPGGKLR